ncbi:MAG: tRNA pseudouridine(38-40) synthase TruA [Gammaproteobacteria bacterium]|nr:tRNA pseudouridine(38-40) synthase TruA [Gammaproteobacteria bacterium]
MRFLGICQYDGSKYSGFQAQKNAMSIQDQLELAISSIGKLEGRINYAGRTDAGVHATRQIFDFLTTDSRNKDQWLKGINSFLPNDINVSIINEISDDFHSRYDAIDRSYAYVIYTGKTKPIFLKDYVFWEKNEIDINIMRDQASSLIGTHNFSSFRGSKCTAKNPIRTLKSIEIVKKGNFIIVNLCANAYLYKMVRIIIGTLLEIALGSDMDIYDILISQDRKKAGKTAKAKGLFFVGATYKKIALDRNSTISDPLSFFPIHT